MIKNIYISSDFLMTKEKEQFSNVKWLYEVLKRPIEQSSGKKQEFLHPPSLHWINFHE